MDKKLLTQQLAENIALHCGIAKKKAETFVRAFFEAAEQGLLSDNFVKVKGFGTFKLVNVSERESININTGERIQIGGHTKISFTPDATLRDLVNRPFAHFETITLHADTTAEELNAATAAPEATPATVAPVADISLVSDTPPTTAEEAVPVPEPSPAPEEPAPAAETPAHEESEPDVPAEAINTTPQEEVAVPAPAQSLSAPAEPMPCPPAPRHLNYFGLIALLLCVIGLLLASYFAGYYHWLCPCTHQATPEVKSQPMRVQRKAVQPDTVAATARPDTTRAQAKPQPVVPAEPTPQQYAKMAAKYEQMPGANYLIIGELPAHKIKAGENLYTIARDTYGDKDFARYIIHHNHYSNPDVITLDSKVKLPKLIKREQAQ